MERDGGLLTREQVADFVGVSVKTIARWDRKGWLPSIRIGRLVRYKPGDVERLLNDLHTK